MTETETKTHHTGKKQNSDSMLETFEVDDAFDATYKDKEGPNPPMKIAWRNVIVLPLIHMGGIYGLILIPSASILTLAWAALCFTLSNTGLFVGGHRLWSHRSFKATFPLRVFLALCQSMGFQDSIYHWAREHRVHHKYSETNADPHNAKRGFFFSHMGWLMLRKHPDVIEKGRKLDLSDLEVDKVVMFQKRYYMHSVVLLCFLVPTLVPWFFWGESLVVGFFVPGLLRYALNLHATWLVNSVAHMWGKRPYDKTFSPADNTLVTIGNLGEGFHNYHHTFPFDYASSEFGQWLNLSTAFIDFMCFLGLASDCRRASKQLITARMKRTGDSSYKSG